MTLALRGAALGRPRTFVFDEIFYANDALDLFSNGVEQTFVGHPPLAKWLISTGFLVGSFSPVTWRLSALVCGAIVVVLVFVTAQRTTASMAIAFLAGVLVLSDGIAHVVGRYALLDGFTAMFVVATVGHLAFTRDRTTFRTAAITGGLCGAAMATKWSAAPLVLVAVTVVARRGRGAGIAHRLALASAVVAMSLAAYVLPYAPWILAGGMSGNCTVDQCDDSPLHRLLLLPDIQWAMLDSQDVLDRGGQTFQMQPGWKWAVQDRDVPLFTERCRGQDDAVCDEDDEASVVRVIARGNSVLWVLWAPLVLAWLVRRRRSHSRPPSHIPMLVGAAAVLWIPWLLFDSAFPFYAGPIVPLVVLGDVTMIRELFPPRLQPVVYGALVGAAALVFVLTRNGPPWAS